MYFVYALGRKTTPNPFVSSSCYVCWGGVLQKKIRVSPRGGSLSGATIGRATSANSGAVSKAGPFQAGLAVYPSLVACCGTPGVRSATAMSRAASDYASAHQWTRSHGNRLNAQPPARVHGLAQL